MDRLVHYYRFLADTVQSGTVTSAHLGAALDVDPSQVRKDFAAIGLMGMSRVGYDACEVCRTIRTVLGFDVSYEAVLIGAGQLGSAILAYPEFDRYGLRVVAAFDGDPFKVGRRIGGHTIRPIDEMVPFVHENGIPMAILCTPVDAAQDLADMLVTVDVKAIWNFTPRRLTVPDGVLARNERFSAGLGEIAYGLARLRKAGEMTDRTSRSA